MDYFPYLYLFICGTLFMNAYLYFTCMRRPSPNGINVWTNMSGKVINILCSWIKCWCVIHASIPVHLSTVSLWVLLFTLCTTDPDLSIAYECCCLTMYHKPRSVNSCKFKGIKLQMLLILICWSDGDHSVSSSSCDLIMLTERLLV